MKITFDITCDEFATIFTLPSEWQSIKTLVKTLNERVDTMATKQDVMNAIAAEGKQVADAVKALEDKVNSGSQITAADLDDIKAAVGNIYNPPTSPVPPVVPPVV